VTKDVPPYAIVAGVPAKVIGRNEFRYYDKSLVELLGDRHLNRSS
jgi:serine acetyltransferase